MFLNDVLTVDGKMQSLVKLLISTDFWVLIGTEISTSIFVTFDNRLTFRNNLAEVAERLYFEQILQLHQYLIAAHCCFEDLTHHWPGLYFENIKCCLHDS